MYDWNLKRKKPNKASKQEVVNQNLLKVKPSNRHHEGCFNFGSGSDEHERAKFELCLRLKREGCKFITEAVFEDGSGIADVLVLDVEGGIVYEVLCSETQERFDEKRYPVRRIIPVKAGDLVWKGKRSAE